MERQPVTPDSIARAALSIMRRGGADAVTMRAVADELGVRAPSLYHHVRDKEALLDLVCRLAFRVYTESRPEWQNGWQPPATAAEYMTAVRAGTLSLRAFYHEHPGLAAILSARPVPYDPAPGSERAGGVRQEIEGMQLYGLSYEVARDTYLALSRWTLAAIAFETRADPAVEDAVFEAGLDMMLAGQSALLSDPELR